MTRSEYPTALCQQMYEYHEDEFFADRSSMMAESYPTLLVKILSELLTKNNLSSPIICDLAAGRGEVGTALKIAFPDAQILESDLSSRVLADTNLQNIAPQIARFSSDLRLLPLKRETVNLLHVKDALVHLDEEGRSAFFTESERVLQPHGILIIVTATEPQSYVNISSSRRPSRNRDVKINTLSEYIHLAMIPHKQQRVRKPFFELNINELITQATKDGLKLIDSLSWTPTDQERDWYIETRPRQILIFQKQSN